MTPLLIPILVFLGVIALVGFVAFVFRDQTPQTATRLEMLVGKRSRQEAQAAEILRKSAFEGDKKSLLEVLTPRIPSIQKLFEQADCNIKPSTLFGMGLLLAILAGPCCRVCRWF
jgi:tight adherence protein B